MLHNFVFKKITKTLPHIDESTIAMVTVLEKRLISSWQAWKYDDNQSTLWYEFVALGATLQYFSVYVLNDPRKCFHFNTVRVMTNNNKNISHLKNANLKKDAVSSIYPRFFTYRSYLSVTEKSNTYDISFPQHKPLFPKIN